jgi:hypothetical protein
MICSLRYPLPLLLYAKEIGLQGRSESVIIITDYDSISTCLLYKIYLLKSSGYGPHDPDHLADWANSWWPPFLFSRSG